MPERTVVIEFETVARAIEVYESEACQQAIAAMGESTERDVPIVAGLE